MDTWRRIFHLQQEKCPALFVRFGGTDRQLSKLMAAPTICFIY